MRLCSAYSLSEKKISTGNAIHIACKDSGVMLEIRVLQSPQKLKDATNSPPGGSLSRPFLILVVVHELMFLSKEAHVDYHDYE